MQKDDRMLLTTDDDPLGRVPPSEWDCDMGCPVTCDDCMGKGSCVCDHEARSIVCDCGLVIDADQWRNHKKRDHDRASEQPTGDAS